MAGTAGFRTEHDSMGEVLVPADALWGAQTQRAVENFPVSGERLPRELIGALALIKSVAASNAAGAGSGLSQELTQRARGAGYHRN